MFSRSSNPSTASNYTVSQRYYWTHDHFASGWWIPDASLWFLIIVQQGTRSKGLQSHQIIEKALVRWFSNVVSTSAEGCTDDDWKKQAETNCDLVVPFLGLVTYKINHLPPNAHSHTYTHSLTPCSHHPWACPSTWSWHVQTTLHETVAFLPLVCHLLPIS